MKTAISVEDRLMEEADQAARAMRVSRSRLVSLALRDYLDQRRREGMLERLNEIYGNKQAASDASLLPKMKAKFRQTVRERW